MHPIDRAAAILFRHGPASWDVFRDGWGDDQQIALMSVDAGLPNPQPIVITWTETEKNGELQVTDGTFASPATHLPDRSSVAHVRMLAPPAPDGRLVVMMAAWNDHGYPTRTTLATRLAAKGITSVMLENPLYGARRAWEDPPVRTVADFAAMGRAAVEEGLALIAHFAEAHTVGIAGYSMGGNIAAMIGAISAQPVAIAALAASHSPGPVWLDGVISNTVRWDALDGENPTERLRTVMSKASVLLIPAEPHTAAAIIVGASGDGYIPQSAVQALHDHWPGSELRWVNAGHASMIWRHKDALAEAIDDSFGRLGSIT